MIRPLFILALVLLISGCTAPVVTNIRNDTGREISVNTGIVAIGKMGQRQTMKIRPGASGNCIYGDTYFDDKDSSTWFVSDGVSKYTFVDVKPIMAMPEELITESWFTTDFPCRRWTLYVRLDTNMMIYAVDPLGRKFRQPEHFPIRYTDKQELK